MIIKHAEIRERVLALHKAGGLPKGSLTGWASIDKLYTVGLGQWTLITGNPNSGKSEWLDALLVNLAKREEWKFYIYSPENFPLETHHAKIAEKYIGKPFNPGPTLRMDQEDVELAEAWMEDKFYFCKPPKPSLQAIMTEALYGTMGDSGSVGEAEKKVYDRPYKCGIVVDPWNQLEHYRPQGLSETEYVSETLSQAINMTRTWNAHLWLVAHPAKLYRDRDGKYPVPTPRDVSGSAHFWNKADNCLTVHRDQVEGSQDVDVHVQKIRFKHIGHIGIVTLLYDRITGRYHEKLGVVKSYATRDE